MDSEHPVKICVAVLCTGEIINISITLVNKDFVKCSVEIIPKSREKYPRKQEG
jgi:hypothetical protein